MSRLFIALVLSAAAARAELQWVKPVQEFHRAPSDGHVEARFAFKNAGTAPVTIRKVRSSCGCTTASVGKKTYAPGESGEILTKFVFGARRGPQRKMIGVAMDDGTEIALDLRVWIEEALAVAPALVWWKTGAALEEKTVSLKAAEGRRVGVKAVASSSARITAKLETVAPGREYLIRVTPRDTAEKEVATITVATDFPPDAPRSHTIHVRIK